MQQENRTGTTQDFAVTDSDPQSKSVAQEQPPNTPKTVNFSVSSPEGRNDNSTRFLQIFGTPLSMPEGEQRIPASADVKSVSEQLRLSKMIGNYHKARIDYWMLAVEREAKQDRLTVLELECALDADSYMLDDLKRRRDELMQRGVSEDTLKCVPFCNCWKTNGK